MSSSCAASSQSSTPKHSIRDNDAGRGLICNLLQSLAKLWIVTLPAHRMTMQLLRKEQ